MRQILLTQFELRQIADDVLDIVFILNTYMRRRQ